MKTEKKEPIFGPILRYRYRFILKSIAKRIRNNETTVQVTAKSNDISALRKEPSDVADAIETSLKGKATVLRRGNRITIQSIKYGKTDAHGAIDIGYAIGRESLRANSFETVLEAPCEYNKFSKQILELSRCLERVNDAARLGLNSPLTFQNFIGCGLKKIYELTGVLSDMKVDYLMLGGGEIELTIETTNVSIAKAPFSDEAIENLRNLVTLFG